MPTPEQNAEIARLIREGVPEDQARALATETQFDAVVGPDGKVLTDSPPLPTDR